MGDFSVKIQYEVEGELIENHGLDGRNNRGDCVAQFSKEGDFIITITFSNVIHVNYIPESQQLSVKLR